MKLRNLRVFLTDLFNVLPARAETDWEEIESLHSDRATVILISGFAATKRNLSVIRKRLIRDGFNVVVLSLDWHSLSDGVRGLYRMAEKLSATALKIRKDPVIGRTRIYLVSHSAGGLVARYYVQLLGGFHYCDGLITLATPHSGTWVAAVGLFTHLILKARCLFHMLPISGFIKKLNRAPFPQDFRFVSVSSRSDLLCYRSSAQLPENVRAISTVQSIEIRELSHSDFLLSKRIYRVVHDTLKGLPAEGSYNEVSKSIEIA